MRQYDQTGKGMKGPNLKKKKRKKRHCDRERRAKQDVQGLRVGDGQGAENLLMNERRWM